MASPTALREWCRAACARYPDVDIKDLSHSFRDGLAFCAIIHKHRPDLIDFSSLSKGNAYLNNKLAFEVAEAELGIPALLDPSDVAGKEPDYLGVVTYLSWHYCFFNRKSYGPASSGSQRANVSGDLVKSGPPGGTKHLQRPVDIEGGGGEGDLCSGRSPRTACPLCFKPVHLIQRRLAEGKVYHRSCFRCAVCRSTLLPGSYTQGSAAGTLVCSHHAAVGSDDASQQENRPAGDRTQCRVQEVSSLSGLVISSAPHYSRRAVSGTAGMEETQTKVKSVKKAAPPPPPPPAPPIRQPDVPDQATGEAGPNPTPAGAASLPVPMPRRRSSSTAAPVPAPRTRTSQPASRAPAAGSSPSQSQSKSSPTPSHVPAKYKANHPWMNIVSPGPWQHLPPTQAPLPAPRTWYRSRAPPSNPFEKSASATAADSGAASRSGSEGAGSAAETVGASAQDVSDSSESDAAAAAAAAAADVAPSENQSDSLPRSLSVPALASKKEGDQAATRQTKTACKVNPFDEKPSFPKSKTFQTFPSRRAPAPGHGFPLIKRKVQTDPCISTESFLVEMRDLDRRLEEMERQGVELERNLRGCKDDKEEERLLLEWFGLHHARHQLVRRDAELCHLTMQQRLEEKQADVEYKLRCLLNKQECDWTQEDRDKEQQLLDELVSIIDQRNLIISSLDQDMQRERGEDKLFEATLESKDLQKERLKELRKSKGKFSPTKVFKKLNHKAAGGKDPAGDKR
ncbi:MICAL-like protein 1 isoform X2 [Nelusetta ayraudi]|uniref:MICAL-like protein 1 isoform X2 n=1 Tax=Nelusetta ayraudi TaxID=303726 RepID=UPI003F6F10DD